MKRFLKNILWFVVVFVSLKNSFAQSGETIIKSDSASKNRAEILEFEFQDIQQNLVQNVQRNPIQEANEYVRLGKLFLKQDDAETAKQYFLKAISQSKSSRKKSFSLKSKSNDFKDYEAHYFLIKAYLKLGNTQQAVKYYQSRNKDFSKIGAWTLLNIEILEKQKKWKDLYDYCRFLEKKQFTKKTLLIIKEKKILAEAKGSVKSNFSNKDRVIRVSIDDKEEDLENLSYETKNELAKTYQQSNQIEKELNIREKLTKSAKISPKQKAVQQKEIAKIHKKQKSEDKALLILKESLKSAQNTSDFKLQKEILIELTALLEKKKKYREATKYYQNLLSVSKALEEEKEAVFQAKIKQKEGVVRQKESLKSIDYQREIFKKDQDISSYEQRLFEEESKFQKSIILFMSIGFLVLFGVLIWYHKQRKKLQKINLQLELKNLRSQMNPHFIFNSLNAVNHFIAHKNELLANEYLTEFALLMRNTLSQSDEDLISLKEEMVFLNRYCELEKMRFENKFEFKFQVDDAIQPEEYAIPPLLLQPFVENAVWHGLRYLEEKGNLLVQFSKEKEQVRIIIEDNGIGRRKSQEYKTSNQKKHQSKGVSLIQRRIEVSNQLSHQKIQWRIEDLEQGTRVIIDLKK
ncbi:MAG: histidine kinase [Flavobacteriales bacterium]|jgi:tetratricopeptide (TPR) repeat protein|nr:histidine kinase [Flavobacteriales bacterium]